MTITEHELDELRDAYKRALATIEKLDEEYNEAIERLDAVREALECDHAELEYHSGFMFGITKCKKCGYEWTDS